MKVVINHISFSYEPKKRVLNNINLDLPANSTISIVGISGSGKSTLLRIIGGLIQKSKLNGLEGKVTLDKEPPIHHIKKGEISFMFQEPTLMPNLTVKQNINFPFRLRGANGVSETNELMRIVGLEEFADFLPSALSGGMKARVALARTFVTKPKLLLLDEPFSSLDVRWRNMLYAELDKLRSIYQPTVIMVTHDIHEAVYLSNHIIVIGRNGTILRELKFEAPLPRKQDMQSFNSLNNAIYEIQRLIIDEQ